MKDKRTFVYVTKDGTRKKYAGKIIENGDGTFNGILTNQYDVEKPMNLEWHPAVEHVDGCSAYYTYVNINGETVNYYSIVKKDSSGKPFFTYTTINETPLIVHPEETITKEYFTYVDKGVTKTWTGKVRFIDGTYYGIK